MVALGISISLYLNSIAPVGTAFSEEIYRAAGKETVNKILQT